MTLAKQINNKGYEYFKDETGETKALDLHTGEILETTTYIVPKGTIFINPDQQRENERKRQAMIRREMQKECTEILGKFFFTLSSEQFDEVEPEHVARLIFLNTFTKFDDNRLMLSQRKTIKRVDLPELLKVSPPTVSRFWNKVSPKYLKEDKNGDILTNCDIFKRGRIKKSSLKYQRLYIENIKKLYNITPTSKHKHLGYIFKLLPYINIEYNILCFNPMEIDIDQIIPLSLEDFCKMINYSISHIDRLLDIYRNITFEANGKQESFCAFTFDGLNRGNAKITINPHIIYGGSDFNKVDVLGLFHE